MDSSIACTVPTADKFNQSTAHTLLPHCSTTQSLYFTNGQNVSHKKFLFPSDMDTHLITVPWAYRINIPIGISIKWFSCFCTVKRTDHAIGRFYLMLQYGLIIKII